MTAEAPSGVSSTGSAAGISDSAPEIVVGLAGQMMSDFREAALKAISSERPAKGAKERAIAPLAGMPIVRRRPGS